MKRSTSKARTQRDAKAATKDRQRPEPRAQRKPQAPAAVDGQPNPLETAPAWIAKAFEESVLDIMMMHSDEQPTALAEALLKHLPMQAIESIVRESAVATLTTRRFSARSALVQDLATEIARRSEVEIVRVLADDGRGNHQ